MATMQRREFLKAAALAPALGVGLSGRVLAAATAKKALVESMLPKELSYLERFRLAAEAGFSGVEMNTVSDPKVAEQVAEAARASGVRVHSVMNSDHWKYPLSSSDPDVVSKCVAGMETSLRNAALWKADTVLLVPAVVNEQTPYQQAWDRSQKLIREKLLPLAQELKVVVAVEDVWNKFLLSPTEFARYVDDFKSPWLQAYFDVGNILFYGYPQDWIRTLGKRIAKVHFKDFKLDRGQGRFEWVNLGDGGVDWLEVKRALEETGYGGWITLEIKGGPADYLKDVSARFDRILAGQPPVPRT
jgi:L-ribulose-5-phosphate 3-epimerase